MPMDSPALVCVTEANLFYFVQHLDGGFQAKAQVRIVHDLANALLLEKAVDVRHLRRQMVISKWSVPPWVLMNWPLGT